jgi:excisionase family DNA binding protein
MPYRGWRLTGEPQAFVTGGLLTVAEVAAAMRVSNMTVYRLIKGGELAAVRVGKNYRIREDDLERFLQERSVQVRET